MADTTIKLSGTYDSIEAYRILEEMRELNTDTEGYKTDAEAAAVTATSAATTAQGHANDASTYATNASTYADNANTSATAAAGSASTASAAAGNALNSETAAAGSASAASTSETNAAASETAAAASAAEAAATLQNYLPLSGGTMTGGITTGTSVFIQRNVDNGFLQFNGATGTGNGANLILFGKEESRAGAFQLTARNGSSTKILQGSADGKLTWGGNKVLTDDAVGTVIEKYKSTEQSISAGTTIVAESVSLSKGVWVLTGKVRFPSIPSGRIMVQIRTGTGIDTTYDSIQAFYSPSAVSNQFTLSVTKIANLSTTTTMNINVYSSSSSACSHVYLNAVRIV